MKKAWKSRSLCIAACMAMILGTMSIPNVVKAADGEATINGVSYDTLEAAVNAVKKDETITLQKDVVAAKAVDASKDYTLDLNGKKLTLSTALVVSGSLTITGNGFMDRTGYGYLIDNSGSLRIENGTYSDDPDNEREHNGVNNAALIRNLGTLSISNGTFTDDGIVIKNDDINERNYGKLIIDGGTFTGKSDFNHATIQNSAIAQINGGTFYGGNATVMTFASTLMPVTTVNGGTFTQTVSLNPIFSSFFYDLSVSPDTEININDGTFIGTFNPNHINSFYQGTVNITIRGGVYDNSIQTGLMDGYGCYEKDGKYVVSSVPSGITLSQTSLLMKVGDVTQLMATIAPETTAANTTWSSSDENIATVKDGIVTAHSNGIATITAKAGDHEAKASISVYKVTAPTPPVVDGSKPVDKIVAGVAKEALTTIQKTTETIVNDVITGKENTAVDKETAVALKDALQAGKAITMTGTSDNLLEKDVTKADLAKIKAFLNKNAVIAQYLDLQMMLKADGVSLGNVTAFEEKLTFTVAIPKSFTKEGRSFYVIRLHDGVVEKLNTNVNKDGSLSFESDRLSLYAIVYEDKIDAITTPDKGETPTDTTKKDTGNSVHTGDTTSLAMPVALMIGSCALIGIVIVLHKKKAILK